MYSDLVVPLLEIARKHRKQKSISIDNPSHQTQKKAQPSKTTQLNHKRLNQEVIYNAMINPSLSTAVVISSTKIVGKRHSYKMNHCNIPAPVKMKIQPHLRSQKILEAKILTMNQSKVL